MVESQYGKTKKAFISPLDRLNALVYLHWSLVLHVRDLDQAIQRLTKGLCRVAEAVPYLKGRVSYPTDTSQDGVSLTTRLVISWGPDDPDLTFREHSMTNKLPDLATMKREGAPAHFFSTDIISLPLFVDVSSRLPQPVFEATYIPIEGGLVLNMCVHHGVMDGRGLATLTEMWAEATRLENGNDAVKFPTRKLPDPDEPLTRTARLVAAAGGNKVDRSLSLEELLRRYRTDHAFGQDLMALLSLTAAGPKCASHIFTFSGAKLEHAKEVLARDGNLNCVITTNSILNAVIWSSITRVRLSRRQQPWPTSVSRFSLAVDGRRRLGLAIDEPGSYLGNVVLISSVDVPLDVLETAGTCNFTMSACSLAPVVQAIAKASARITTDHISGLLSALQQVQDSSDVGPGWLSPHRVNFMASSWANLPLYECDFGPMFSEDSPGNGPGTPVFVRYPYAEYNDGNVVVLPRRRTPAGGDEAIEVYVMLAEEDLQALKKDDVFVRWLKT
ncbi:trichothecene 8-O-acetyltransferase [Hypoxylon sp. FL0890]|nr:trichothecene 8-O-acetyltransferase [Hypoxylon sp. FL0890]